MAIKRKRPSYHKYERLSREKREIRRIKYFIDQQFNRYAGEHLAVAENLDLKFEPPASWAGAAELISQMSVMLDFFIGRSGDYNLLMIASKSLPEYWQIIAKHVTNKGISLESVSFEQLGLRGVMAALAVFCRGITETEIPQLYLLECGGINKAGVSAMLADIISRGQNALADNIPAEKIFGESIGMAALHSAKFAANNGYKSGIFG